MQPDGLASVRLKINRAHEHVETFKRETREFFEHEPHRAVFEADEQGEVARGLRLLEPIPEHWPCIVGDCLQNLRQALDHFIWACAIKRKPNPPKLDFPIKRDRAAWDEYVKPSNRRGGGKTPSEKLREAVGKHAWRLIEKMQPHTRLHTMTVRDADRDALWQLHELARIDRHQTLHVIPALQMGTAFSWQTPPCRGNAILWEEMAFEVGPEFHRFLAPPTKDDTDFGTFTLMNNGVETEVRAQGYAAFDIAFDEETPLVFNALVLNVLSIFCESLKTILPVMEQVYADTR